MNAVSEFLDAFGAPNGLDLDASVFERVVAKEAGRLGLQAFIATFAHDMIE